MKNYKLIAKTGLVALTLQGGLIASAVAQEDVAITPYKGPKNMVGAGGTIVTKRSAKFGEYTGLNKSRVNAVFELNGGNGGNLAGGTMLWKAVGTDLGTTSRNLTFSMSDQGKWKVNAGYDELKHLISDTYQTPLLGAAGSNVFNLPPNFGSINTAAPTGLKIGTNTLTDTQLSLFRNEEVATTRKTSSVGAGYSINPNLDVRFDYSHLDQDGAKLISVGTQGLIAAGGGSTSTAQAISQILNPTRYKTDTFNLDLSWFGDRGQLTGGYFGQLFNNAYNSVIWQTSMNAAACNPAVGSCVVNNSMGTSPDNVFHQLNLNGSYKILPSLKVIAGASYGRNTQKDDFANTAVVQPNGTINQPVVSLPVTSLGGKVIQTHADLKLVHQTTDKLTLTAGSKFNQRKNETPSRVFAFVDIRGNTATVDTEANTPYSHRKISADLAADFKITPKQNVRLFGEHEIMKRWCVEFEENTGCVVAPRTKENRLGTNYKWNITEDLRFNAGYTYANRRSVIDPTYTNVNGVNGGNVVGFVAFPYANRVRHFAKTGVNWQTTESLDLSLSGSYSRDRYHVVLGPQSAYAGIVNLDATYLITENHTVTGYLTGSQGSRKILNSSNGSPTTPGTQRWENKLLDTGKTVGLASEHKGILGGKIGVINFDASYSKDESKYSTAIFYLAPTVCAAPGTLSCGDLPIIRSTVVTLKLTDNYAINDKNDVSLEYMWQKRASSDYMFNGLQYQGTSAAMMPTNEKAPSYTENLIALNYSYRF